MYRGKLQEVLLTKSTVVCVCSKSKNPEICIEGFLESVWFMCLKKKKKDSVGRGGPVMRGCVVVEPVCVRCSCRHSCARRGCGAPRNFLRLRPGRGSSGVPSASRKKGRAECSPCCPHPGPGRRRSRVACFLRCRRRSAGGRTGAGRHAASRWSPGRTDASWGCTASTFASGCVWKKGSKRNGNSENSHVCGSALVWNKSIPISICVCVD